MFGSRRFSRTKLVAACLMLAASLGVAMPASPVAAEKQQWRSYWVDTFHDGIYNQGQVDKLVADAKAVKANVLIVQVGRWMDCFCNRSTFPRTHVPIDPSFDPLESVIEKAHAEGIEVHAWVNATPMWNTAGAPPQADHIFNSHGPDAEGRDRWLGRKFDGTEVGGTYSRVIDPGHPDATDYVVKGIASIAKNYDIDGINLDYIRYPDYNTSDDYSDWGYNETSLARFRAATGRTDTPEPSDPQFTAWRRDQVTSYVRKIYLTLYGIDPSDRLSINGITYMYGPQGTAGGYEATRTYRQVMQDWKGWLEEGIVDTVVTMNYKRETSPGHTQMFEQWSEFLADNQGNRQGVTGPGIYLNSLENNLLQARKALAPTAKGNKAAGWSGYSYASPSATAVTDPTTADAERAALTEALTRELFTDEAAVPSMPWKASPRKGHVAGSLLMRDGTPLDQVKVELSNPVTGKKITRLSDGKGWIGFVDVAPGVWTAKVKLPSGVVGKSIDAVRVRKGGLAKTELGPFVRLP